MDMDTLTESQARIEKLFAQLKDPNPDHRTTAATRLKTLSDNTEDMVHAVHRLSIAAGEARHNGEEDVYHVMCASGLSLMGAVLPSLDPTKTRDLQSTGIVFLGL